MRTRYGNKIIIVSLFFFLNCNKGAAWLELKLKQNINQNFYLCKWIKNTLFAMIYGVFVFHLARWRAKKVQNQNEHAEI